MSEFDSIRPYDDAEVAMVLRRMLAHPDAGAAASRLLMPGFLRGTRLGACLSLRMLRLRTRDLQRVDQCQAVIADYMAKLIDETIDELSVEGLADLDPQGHYLFMSNHRDITMDSCLLNYLLHRHGFGTSRIAVGDNLMSHALAADLMRLNKSFVIQRELGGARAALKILSRTSRYIRQSLEDGVSIWIAQRQGRSKDGWDRTDPALVKMLSLAHKAPYQDGPATLSATLAHAPLVPVSISYEVDPCALLKARELYLTERDGSYEKGSSEDLTSMTLGISGAKGRVHIHFGTPLEPRAYATPAELAATIDEQIVGNMQLFPTHLHAAEQLGESVIDLKVAPPNPHGLALLEEQIEAVDEAQKPYLLMQYANAVRNAAHLEA